MKYFCLFSSCRIVNGYNRCSISDLERNKNYIIPNEISSFFIDNKVSINTIKKNPVLEQWVNIFHKSELGFFTNNHEYYPPISLEWDTPQMINNSIIEADDLSINDLKKIIQQLHILKCRFLEIRYYKKNITSNFYDILEEIKLGGIIGINIYIPYSENNTEKLKMLLDSTLLIKHIIIHSSKKVNINNNNERIYFTKQKITSAIHCGIVNESYFAMNIKTFTESQHHNTCLNRKISIDIDGNIKNCPSMSQSFGNIKDTSLKEALNQPDFKKYWNITKDMIKVCKDCEFRHICTDCRAYTERNHLEEEIDLSKPLKCGYNPYTNEWTEWSTNPLKQNEIKYYKMQKLVKK